MAWPMPLKIQRDSYFKSMIIEVFHQIGAHSGAHSALTEARLPELPHLKAHEAEFSL